MLIKYSKDFNVGERAALALTSAGVAGFPGTWGGKVILDMVQAFGKTPGKALPKRLITIPVVLGGIPAVYAAKKSWERTGKYKNLLKEHKRVPELTVLT